MSENNHSLDTEYSGGAISPPPNKIDLEKVKEILDKAKSIGYQGIKDAVLEPKHKEDSFEYIPMCLPEVTQLLKSIGLKVFDGSSNSGNSEKKKSEVKEAVKKAVEMSEAAGKIGGGLSSETSDLMTKITSAASQFMSPEEISETNVVAEVFNDLKSIKSSSNSSNSSIAKNNITDFSSLRFINLDSIDIKSKKTKNKAEEFLKNPEFVITNSSIDRETDSANRELERFKKKFADIKERLLANIEKYPEKLNSQYFTALTAIDVARGSNQLAINQLENKYHAPFGKELEVRNDLPEEWKPVKPVI